MVCSKCNLPNDSNNYPWCKVCRKEYDRQYHKGYQPKRRILNKAKKARKLEWLWSLKSKPCTDCKQRFHPAAMHFDHLPEFDKLYEVSFMVSRGFSETRILAEIEKCELVCANCHAIRTYNRLSVA